MNKKQTKTLELSTEDSAAFLETLRNPLGPNEALREAAKAHEELINDKTEIGEESRAKNSES